MQMSNSPMNRRAFLTAIPAIASTSLAAAPQKLAVDGGQPVRAAKLTSAFPGAQFFDQQERTELTEAYDAHSLFRYYGPGTTPPQKVAKFEEEFRAFMGVKYALALTSGTASLHTG